MSFEVVPESIEGFAAQIDRAAEALTKAKSYLNQYAELGGGGDLFRLAVGAHEKSVRSTGDRLNQSASILSTSSAELRAPARYYRQTDRQATAALDQTVPYNPTMYLPSDLEREWKSTPCRPAQSYVDARHPLTRLTPVAEPDYSHPLGFLDNVSVSHWANQPHGFRGLMVDTGFPAPGVRKVPSYLE